MKHLNMQDLLIPEEDYAAQMASVVLPYLAARCTEHTLFREKGHPVYCVQYTPLPAAAKEDSAAAFAQKGITADPTEYDRSDTVQMPSSAAPEAAQEEIAANSAKCAKSDTPQVHAPAALEAVIVISHGFTESALKYREMIYYFLHAGYAVFIFDHCGHGKSYRLIADPSKVHIDDYHRYVDDLLFAAHYAKELYPGLPLYLYAHSMGGGIGAAAAAEEPALFSKVILTSPMIRNATGAIPWTLTHILVWLLCHIGKAKDYAPTQHAYDGKDTFADSASTSEARFAFYQQIREENSAYRTNGATCSWLYNAVKMSNWLQKEGWKHITAPVILFQAENDGFVINEQEELFIKKIRQSRCLSESAADARLIRMPGTKHEIFNSTNDVLEKYLEEIFRFYKQ